MSSMRSVKIMLGILATIFVVVYIGGAWYFSSVILHTQLKPCDKAIYVYCGKPSSLKLPYKDVTFKSEDNKTLKGWWVPAKSPDSKQTIVIVHGRNGTRHAGLRFSPALRAANYNVLMFDLRHNGESERSFSSMGYHEQKDVAAAIDFAEKRTPNIGIMGFSMGSSTSIMVMARDKRIKAGVFEGGYSNAKEVLVERAKLDYGLPEFPLIPMVFFLTNMRGKMDLGQVNPAKVIGSISPRGVYIIHGKHDRDVLPRHGKVLFAKAKEPKQYWEVDAKGHIVSWKHNKKKAESQLVAFFDKFLKAKPKEAKAKTLKATDNSKKKPALTK